jgi:hypothetical protein
LVFVAKANREPVVEVCAAKCRLDCFQKKYTIHYKIFVREKYEEMRQGILVPSSLMYLLSPSPGKL